MVELIVATLAERGQTVAVAESLTGGTVAARLVAVPGVSTVFRGAVVAYATDLKATLLDVPPELLAQRGPVDADVAARMAEGVARRLDATYGLSTTGVAGPGAAEGIAAGTVFIAVAGPGDTHVRALHLSGDRASVREQAADEGLELLAQVVLGTIAHDQQLGNT